MRIIIAPDKFKGCLSAGDVALSLAAGVRDALPSAEIDACPMADGGEGTVDAMVAATGGRIVRRRVTGPRPEMKVDAPFGILGDGQTAVIEMAAASGLHLLRPEQYDPMATTTYGTGELLMAAAEMGARRIILGIGGSATVDGGLGCAQACGGVPVLEGENELGPITRPATGGDVARLLWQAWDDRFSRYGVKIIVACDVTNPLVGPNGAARIFGPQKGATPEQVERLDAALERLARKLRSTETLAKVAGAGAAGGLGFGMMAFFGAELRSGFEVVTEATGLRQRVAGADLCITGEGRLDAQSLSGKTCIGVARMCRSAGVRCVAIVGSVGEGAEEALREGLERYVSVGEGLTLEESISRAPQLLRAAARELIAAM